MKVNEETFDTLKRVEEITGTNYDIKWTDSQNIEGFIFSEDLFHMIKDLICEVDRLKEEIEDIKQDIQDNYRPIPYAEQVGISDRDFI